MSEHHCLSCGALLAKDMVKIGKQYPSAIFVDDNDPIVDKLEPTSLNVARCTNEKCTLVQLNYKSDLQYVFDHYPYESNSTASMKSILQAVVDSTRHINLMEDDVILDIGGNDGTLLSLVPDLVRARVNIDAAAGVEQVVSDFDYVHIHAKFNAEIYRSLDLPSPRLIFSTAMFYHLNNPVDFCKDVHAIMSDDTVWVLQLTYLGTMLEDNIFDNIVHEHAAYYSLASLEYLLSQVGLHVAEAQIVKSYGGSLRVFITKKPIDWRKDYYKVQRYEEEHKTNTSEALYAFNSRVQLLRKSIKAVIDHLVHLGGPLWGFGASTKGNMILQFLGIGVEHISRILDNGPKKIGKRTLGTNIPIVEEASYLDRLPKYILVLPYYYTDVFIGIIQKNLMPGQEVLLLIPLPYPHFIRVSNGK